MHRIGNRICVLLLLALVMTTVARAADVVGEVPRDALGFAVVRQLGDVEAKSAKVLEALGATPAGLLTLLKSIGGVEAGLDAQRELLVVLLPPESNSRQFHLAVWLPAKDYDALVTSLEGDPERQVAAVTIAGEDLLVVKHGDWAVMMDPDQRDRIEQLQEGTSANETVPPRQMAMWSAWINTNDATVVVLPAGMRMLWALAASEQLFTPPTPTPVGEAIDEDDLFGPAGRQRQQQSGWPAVRHWIRSTFGDAPEFARWAAEAQGMACGLKLDDAGNAVVGGRLVFPEDSVARTGDAKAVEVSIPPRLYDGGEFVLTGSGEVSRRWLVPAVAPYVRQIANDIAAQFGHQPNAADIAKFRQAVEQAATDVQAFSLLTRPGGGADGVFTNNFLALSVASPSDFLRKASGLVDIWNAMLGKTEGGKLLVFQSRLVTIDGHLGMEYAIDMTAAVGGPAIPEIKASMEKLFGPGGKFRLQLLPMDERTVMLAVATEEQVAAVLQAVGEHKTNTAMAEIAELREPAKLLATERDWQVFLSPHGYNEWLRRQMDAILGAVIGGPVVPEFVVSPPVGIVGGVDGTIVWAEVALPAKTIRAAGKYVRR